MVLTRGATKGKSLAGMVPWRNITRLTEVIAMISPITLKTLITPVIIFKMPAVIGFQVFIFKPLTSNGQILAQQMSNTKSGSISLLSAY